MTFGVGVLLALASAGCGGSPRCGLDVPKSCKLLCEDGKDPESCARYGAMRERGQSVERSLQDATHYYALGCTQGHGGSCLLLGYKYLLGLGAEPSPEEATKAFKAACFASNGEGCAMYGAMWEASHGPEGKAGTRKLFDRACSLDSALGCEWLGDLLVSSDRKAALEVYGRACSKGSQKACLRLTEAATSSSPAAPVVPEPSASAATSASAPAAGAPPPAAPAPAGATPPP